MEQKKNSKASNKDFINSINALDIVNVATNHIWLVFMTIFKAKIIPNADIETRIFQDPKNKENMMNMLIAFGLYLLNKDCHGLYQCGYFSSNIDNSELI